MFDRIKTSIVDKLRGFLKIYPAADQQISIRENMSFDMNIAVNKLWYRGDSYELSQAYRQISGMSCSFWGSVPTHGLEIRKIHTGLPKTMVNILSGMIADDLQDLKFQSESDKLLWDDMDKENHLKDVVKQAISQTLVTGDGAFKISIDSEISAFPILAFYEADHIDLHREHGRIQEIIFKTPYIHNDRLYILYEHYGNGYVTYELKDSYGKLHDLSDLPQTAELEPVRWNGDFMLAEYVQFYSSEKQKGRGQSIFDAKRDNFDALDEAWSQWMDALRQGRSKTYIPECLLPRDENGLLLSGNAFDNRFIKIGNDTSETAQNKIDVEQPAIPHDSYLSTYVTALDLCLQGIVSPSTLGIDTKKLDNAEAQREKEKTTLYTRQTIVNALQNVLPRLIQKIFYAYHTALKLPLKEMTADVTFGEYANPSFESQVETVSKARQGGFMSINASLDELYGDTKTDVWKAEEAERIRKEQGVVDMDEPALDMNFGGSMYGGV